jgi:WD40 repeat protein
MAVSNLHDSVDIYDIPSGFLKTSIKHKMGDNVLLPVVFLHEGVDVLTGSAIGDVCMWKTSTGSCMDSFTNGSKSAKFCSVSVADLVPEPPFQIVCTLAVCCSYSSILRR